MSSPRTRTANQARLVRCSAGCGTNVWLAGALPTTADLSFVCDRCVAKRKAAEAERELARCGAVDILSGRGAVGDEKSGTPQPPDPGAGRTSTGCEPAGLDPASVPLSSGGAR